MAIQAQKEVLEEEVLGEGKGGVMGAMVEFSRAIPISPCHCLAVARFAIAIHMEETGEAAMLEGMQTQPCLLNAQQQTLKTPSKDPRIPSEC
mmetsp:Transcript_44367/g.84849  ORF Transcript_44367/g.84849 Transcript_44367/m.84849 type:complete len:92 (-) Transcript_44367:184-459(-)